MKKKDEELRYEVKKGTQLFWFLCGYIVFMVSIAAILFSKNLEYGFLISVIFYTIMGIYTILAITEKFGSDYEIIRAYDDVVLHIKKNQFENRYKWAELTYKKINKHYEIPIGKYTRKHLMKTEYSFYKDGQIVFKVSDIDVKPFIDFIEFIEEQISLGTLKEEKLIFNNEEVLEIKTDKSQYFSLGLEVFVTVAFWLIFLFATLFTPFEGMGWLLFIYTLVLLFQTSYFKREYKQLHQLVYVVKEYGFYIIKGEENTFYKFNELDEAEVEYYYASAQIANKLIIYKDNKELIVLTNSNEGFYEFLEILKENGILK